MKLQASIASCFVILNLQLCNDSCVTSDESLFLRTANISEDEAMEALFEFVNTKRCCGKGAAKKMRLTKISSCYAFHVSTHRP